MKEMPNTANQPPLLLGITYPHKYSITAIPIKKGNLLIKRSDFICIAIKHTHQHRPTFPSQQDSSLKRYRQ